MLDELVLITGKIKVIKTLGAARWENNVYVSARGWDGTLLCSVGVLSLVIVTQQAVHHLTSTQGQTQSEAQLTK